MKRHLKIIKGLGMILLFFVLVSTIGVSDSSYKASAKIVQASTEGDDEDAKTIINTYDKECNDPTGIHITAEILGSGEKTITDKDDVTPTEEYKTPVEDQTADKSQESVTKPPAFEHGESVEEFNAEVDAWIHYLLEETLLRIDEFPVDITDIANVK